MSDQQLYDTVSSPSRRRFIKGLGAAGAATTVGASASSPAAAQTVDDPWENYTVSQAAKDALTAGNVPAIAFDYLMGTDYVGEARTRLANHAHRSFGDMSDYAGYTGIDALRMDTSAGAVEMELSNEKVMTSIQNNIEAFDNVAYAKAQVAIAEAVNSGKSVEETRTDASDAIHNYAAKIEANLLNHYETQRDQAAHMFRQIREHTDSTNRDLIGVLTPNNNGTWDSGLTTIPTSWHWGWNDGEDFSAESRGGVYTHTVTLADGSTKNVTVSMMWLDSTTDPTSVIAPHYSMANSADPDNTYTSGDMSILGMITTDSSGTPTNNRTFADIGTNDVVDAEDIAHPLDARLFDSVWTSLQDQITSVVAEMDAYAGDVHSAYEAGQIDISDIADPTTYATELSTENNRGFRQAAASQLGIPTTAKQHVVINIHWPDQDDTKVWTDLFTEYTPTDGSGNEIGWSVGQTYEPSTWSAPLFIVYEDDEGNADMSQLGTSFTIVEAYDQEGNDITNFDNTSTTTHTSDVSQLADQLENLRKEQQRLAEMYSTDDGTSGGGGSSSSGLLSGEWMGIPKAGVLLGGAGVSLLGYELFSDDDKDRRGGGGRY